MNPFMNELLAKERIQRLEREIIARELIHKAEAQRPARFKFSTLYNKISNIITTRIMKKNQFKVAKKAVEVLD